LQIGKWLTNLLALLEVGISASRRLPRPERVSHGPIAGADAITVLTGPVLTDGGARIPATPGQPARASPPC
jgi:hypothetical protein